MPLNDETIIQGCVNNFKKIQKKMFTGEAYYRTHNTEIMERRKQFYNIAQSRYMDDFTKANFKLPSNFTKKIVLQKVNYLINGKMSIDKKDGLEDLIDLDRFKVTLKKLGVEASNKVRGVLYWYIENGELKNKIIPSEKMVLVYDDFDENLLRYVMEYYIKEDKDGKKVEYVNVYDDSYIMNYRKVDDDWQFVEERPNMTMRTTTGDDVEIETKASSWGMPPFSILWNNDEKQNDLEMFKPYVDMYDIVNSDFGNNFDDFSEAYWILKGYNGQDAEAFIEEFKQSRIAKVSNEGGMSQETQEVPSTGRKTYLDILRMDIYDFAMAVNPKDVTGNMTNVAIKALFSDLDLKTNDFEIEVQKFLMDSLYFINKYAEIMSKKPVEKIDITFNRSMILNNRELIQSSNESVGNISEETRLANDPRVNDVEEEIEKMNAEKDAIVIQADNNLGF